MTPKQFEDQFQRVLEMTNGFANRHGHPPLNSEEVASLRRQCVECWNYEPPAAAEARKSERSTC